LYPSIPGIEGVMGSEPADGVDGCIREVRKQVGVGADWVKVKNAHKCLVFFRNRAFDCCHVLDLRR
jgi:hypothetical protein